MGPDMEQQVTWRCHGGVLLASEHRERMQPNRARSGYQAAPQIGTEPDDAAQFALGNPETNGSPEAAQITQQLAGSLLAA